MCFQPGPYVLGRPQRAKLQFENYLNFLPRLFVRDENRSGRDTGTDKRIRLLRGRFRVRKCVTTCQNPPRVLYTVLNIIKINLSR